MPADTVINWLWEVVGASNFSNSNGSIQWNVSFSEERVRFYGFWVWGRLNGMLSTQSTLSHSGLFQPWRAADSSSVGESSPQSGFVELPPASDFQALRAHEDFTAVQTQFLREVRELKLLAQAYVSNRYDKAIDTFLTKLENPTDDLLNSLLPLYRETRFQIHRLVVQLKRWRQSPANENSQQSSGIRSYLASVLHDCLDGIDLCPAGVHSRFARSFLDLEAILHGGLAGRLYKQRNDVFSEFIQTFLWQSRREGSVTIVEGMEVHWFNALYNLYCGNLALVPIEDPQAMTNLPDDLLSCFLHSAPLSANACVILRRIADSWSQQLVVTLGSVGCGHWLTRRTRSDENTAIGVDALISRVFNPVNSLMGTTTNNPLNLAAVMDLSGSERFHLKRHREKIQAWLASYFYRDSVTVFAKVMLPGRKTAYIGSINELFFWVFDHDRSLSPGQPCTFTPDRYSSLQLVHLFTIDFSSWSDITSHALLTQAMAQTHDPADIAMFFLNSSVTAQLGTVHSSVRQVLSNQLCEKLVRQPREFKEKLCQSICRYFVDDRARSATEFSLHWLINTPILEPVLTGLSQRRVNISRVTRCLNTWQIADWPGHRLKALLSVIDCRRLFKQAYYRRQLKTLGYLLLTGHCDALAYSSSDRLYGERKLGQPCSESLLNLFARSGDLTSLKYLLMLAQQDTLTRADAYQAQAALINQRSKYGHTPLLSAARHGQVECLQELINITGVKVNVQNESGLNALHLAANYGHLSCVLVLLQVSGIDLNGRTLKGMTPLNTAVDRGHLDIVRTLLTQSDIKVNEACYRGVGPLQRAAQNGHQDIVRIMLATPGVEVNAKNKHGWTPLNSAASSGHLQCVRLLLQASGILVNEPCDNGWSPLNGAAHHGHCDVVKVLLQAPGIEVNVKSHAGWTPLNNAASEGFVNCVQVLLSVPGVLVNEVNTHGCSPLSTASQGGHLDCVRLLLKTPGVDVNQLCCIGLTPLSYAARFGHLEVLKAILAEPKVLVNFTGNDTTALFYAADFNHPDIVRELLQVRGVLVNIRRGEGWTPLSSAAEKGYWRCIRELLKVDGIEVNQTNDFGWTPLSVAARYGQLQCIEQLLEVPEIEVNKQNNFGWAPLHQATREGHWGCVRVLSQVSGIDANLLTSEGYCALGIATRLGDAQSLQILLATPGIDVNQLTTDGQFALGIAADQGYLHCLQLLLARPAIDVNITGRNGSCALHLAVASGRARCVRALLQARGVDINKRDHFNQTPLELAVHKQFKECVELLRQARAHEYRKRPLSLDAVPPGKVARYDS